MVVVLILDVLFVKADFLVVLLLAVNGGGDGYHKKKKKDVEVW
jgi:hypothetical protein